MASSSSSSSSTSKLILPIFCALVISFSLFSSLSYADTFDKEVDVIWGKGNSKMDPDGKKMSLSLDTKSGSGFQSKDAYYFGRIDMQIKLVPGNSAGTVSTYYLSSSGPYHDEVDLEFLGNVSGQPYVLHTNLFAHGKGDREQQFYLWFDPTADFHNYTFLWNTRHIAFLVDGIPIRDFKNQEKRGVYFPRQKPMNVFCSIWDGDGWATMGGAVKTDWKKAPFTVQYRNFDPQACVSRKASMVCNLPDEGDYTWLYQDLDESDKQKMKWVHDKYKIYDYCTDTRRWAPNGLPLECTLDK